jgi:hypothetical protein
MWGDVEQAARAEGWTIRIAFRTRHCDRVFASLRPSELARDWAEDMRAPVPLPIEQFVCGLVQPWPLSAPIRTSRKTVRRLPGGVIKAQLYMDRP